MKKKGGIYNLTQPDLIKSPQNGTSPKLAQFRNQNLGQGPSNNVSMTKDEFIEVEGTQGSIFVQTTRLVQLKPIQQLTRNTEKKRGSIRKKRNNPKNQNKFPAITKKSKKARNQNSKRGSQLQMIIDYGEGETPGYDPSPRNFRTSNSPFEKLAQNT